MKAGISPSYCCQQCKGVFVTDNGRGFARKFCPPCVEYRLKHRPLTKQERITQMRKCWKCKCTLPFSDFCKDSMAEGGIRRICKACKAANAVCKRSSGLWGRGNKRESYNAYMRAWMRIDHEKNPQKRKMKHERERDLLTDSYVAKRLRGDLRIPITSMPKELIEAKRVQMKIMRAIKEKKT